VTDKWDIALPVGRGYGSDTLIHAMARTYAAQDRPVYLYYFGDCDPSGRDAARVLEKKLRHFAPEVDLHFEIVAVTDDQIAEWNLPTKPPKSSDTRTKNWAGGGTVELEAISANRLRAIAEDCIERHVDWRALDVVQIAEEEERHGLEILAWRAQRDGLIGGRS